MTFSGFYSCFTSLFSRIFDIRATWRTNPNNLVADSYKQTEVIENLDIIIVEDGVAGAAEADALGEGGCQVFVHERDYKKLIELGLEDCLEDVEVLRVLGFAFYKDGERIKW